MIQIQRFVCDICRTREELGNCVQQRLNPLVAIGRSHQDRRNLLTQYSISKYTMDELFGNLFLGKQKLHQFVAVHRQCFEHLLPGMGRLVGHGGRNGLATDLLAVCAVEVKVQ